MTIPGFQEKPCGECGQVVAIIDGDYLCLDCRADFVESTPMDEKVEALVAIAIQMWPGWVMVRDQTEPHVDPNHGWVELALVEPGPGQPSSHAFASAVIYNNFAIWKYTGDIYRTGPYGFVEDEPMDRKEFLSILSNPHRTVL